MSLLNSTQHIIKNGNIFVAVSEYGTIVCLGRTYDDCMDRLVELIKQEAKFYGLSM